jgi:hypothetical protein
MICGKANAPAESMKTMVHPEVIPGLAKGITTRQ